MPYGAVYVGRPTIWGNPFAVTRSSDFHGLPGSWFVRGEDGAIHHPDHDTQSSARRKAVDLYAAHVLEPSGARVSVELARAELAGHDLVCWCPRGEPCHADFLLAIANRPAAAPAAPAAPFSITVAAGGDCPRCGVPRFADQRVPRQGAEEQTVAATPQRVTCSNCGYRDGTTLA